MLISNDGNGNWTPTAGGNKVQARNCSFSNLVIEKINIGGLVGEC